MGRKKPSDYAPKCISCDAKTEHFSGHCKSCRNRECKRCGKRFDRKVVGQEMCKPCTTLTSHVDAWSTTADYRIWNRGVAK